MNLFTKRLGLVLAGVVGVGAIASLAIGASFALFTSNVAPQTSTFTTGTLSLTAGSASSTTTDFTNLEPGSNPGDSYQLDLGGSLNAFVGLDATWTSTAGADATGPCASDTTPNAADCSGAGQLPLLYPGGNGITLSTYDRDGSGAGQILLRGSGSPSDNVGTSSNTTCSLPSGGAWTCTGSVSNIEVFVASTPTTGYPWGGPEWAPGTDQTLDLSVAIAPGAGNGIQGSTASFTLTGHAVQYDHNNVTATSGNGGCASGTTGGSSAPDLFATPAQKCPVAWK